MTSETEILLVEDQDSDAEMTIRALRRNNAAVAIVHVKDGQKALEFLFATGGFSGGNPRRPKVILLDVKMPKMTGIEVLRELKSSGLTRRIPVVMLTSSSEDRDIEQAYLLGANSYIVKPVEFADFNRAVTDLAVYWTMHNQT